MDHFECSFSYINRFQIDNQGWIGMKSNIIYGIVISGLEPNKIDCIEIQLNSTM